MFELDAGIDLGTTFVKPHIGTPFPSGISYEFIEMANNVLEIDGNKIAMGIFNHKSSYGTNTNKNLNPNIRPNFIYALYRIAEEMLPNTEEVVFRNVVIGIPAKPWKLNLITDKMRQVLNLQEPIDVKLNGKSKTISVRNIDIVPEGATAYYAMDYSKFDGQKTLLIDWGGLTVNQILFENDEIIDLDTDESGVLKVYQDMVSEINGVMGSNVKMEDMFNILTNGLYLHGEKKDINLMMHQIGLKYCENLYRKLKLRWGVDSIRYVPMVGSGSITMQYYFKQFIPQAELQDNAQTLAAKGMYEIAKE